MPPVIWIALLLAVGCFASFAWAIKHLFIVTSGTLPKQMRFLSLLGSLFFVAQLVALVMPADSAMLAAQWVGVVLYITSVCLFWMSVPVAKAVQLRIAFVQFTPSSILTTGPYEYIRHPFYASYLLFWIAGVAVSQRPALLLSVVCMGALYAKAISQEEREFLTGPLASEYAAYRKRTGALIPKLWR